MLCLSGFELYSRWVPLTIAECLTGNYMLCQTEGHSKQKVSENAAKL